MNEAICEARPTRRVDEYRRSYPMGKGALRGCQEEFTVELAALAALAVRALGLRLRLQRPDFRPARRKQMRPTTVTKAFKVHSNACGLPTSSCMTCATGHAPCCWPAASPMKVVQIVLAHGSPEATRRTYAHVWKKVTGPVSRWRPPPGSCPDTAVSNP